MIGIGYEFLLIPPVENKDLLTIEKWMLANVAEPLCISVQLSPPLKLMS